MRLGMSRACCLLVWNAVWNEQVWLGWAALSDCAAVWVGWVLRGLGVLGSIGKGLASGARGGQVCGRAG